MKFPPRSKFSGIHASVLNAHDISAGGLEKYDMMFVGVRAYASGPDLKPANGRLLEYVKNGGVIVVHYHTMYNSGGYGPYAYSLPPGAENVVDENVPVILLDPSNP